MGPRMNVLLLLLGVAASVVLAENVTVTPAADVAAQPVAPSQLGEVQGTAQEDDNLEVAALWKKAVKLGKCIDYKKRLVECTPSQKPTDEPK